jgi:tRNA A-37 threonylcarbamoyl transferase component Bud32/tetratricopeptide (TPR) repeat protein
MTSQYDEHYAGEVALKKKWINASQLEECKKLRQQSSPPKALARIMFEKGYLDEEQLGQILKEYRLTVGEMSPDESDPGSIEFGEAVVKQGLAKNVDIWDAIDERARRGMDGAEDRLGQILVERGTLAITQAQEILESQGKKILKCAECGHQYNVREFNPSKEYTCLNCGGPLAPPEAVSSLMVEGTAVDSQTVKQTMDDKFVGKEIGGCEILEKLGEGGMGAVYKARHITLNKVVAVKVMSSALMGEVHRKRFLREARAAAQLEHQNIVQVHDTGVAEGYNYIVMQFIDGQSIQKKINSNGKFDQKQALGVIRDAADALGFAHKRHMIHRDIKPDNIMLTKDNIVKVADFGLVKSTDIEKDLTGMSQSMLMGTPHYMSPEQFEGKIIDNRTDIYSLGVTLYYMLTGQRPYDGTTPYQIMQGHLQQEFVDPSNLSEDIYPAVSQLVRKMMARDRERRYQTCEDIIPDIDKMLGGFEDGTIAAEDFIIIEDDLSPTIQAKAPEVVGKKAAAVKQKKSSLLIVVPILVLVLAVAAVLAFIFLANGEENGEKPPATGGPDEPAHTDQREAELAFRETRRKANNLVDKDEFAQAMVQWKGFVPKWGKDPWEENVAIERADILQRALKRFREMIASGKKADIEKALQETNMLAEAQPDEKLATLAQEADQKLKSMESDQETRERKLKEFEAADIRAQKLKEEGKLEEARAVYHPEYVNSEISEIKSKAVERVVEIDRLLAALEKQKEDYRKAVEEAQKLLASHQYGEAKAVYLPFLGQEYLAEIRDDAQERIKKIEEDWDKHADTQFGVTLQTARDKFDNGDYSGARKAIADYLYHKVEKYAKEAGEFDKLIQSYQEFQGKIKIVDKHIDKKEFDEALEIARNYESSENHDFSKIGREKVMEIRRKRFLDNNLVFIDGGKISIGSNEPHDRNPSRSVDIQPFYMDRTEVTNAQYEGFVKATGHKAPLNWSRGRPQKSAADHPVTWVTYKDAIAYCKWRSRKEGVTYRLPRESEWEYAASYDPAQGKKTVYPWGDEYNPSYANLGDGSTRKAGSSKKDKSPLGIYDMAGNVAEFSTSDDGKSCVVRGGSMDDDGKAQAGRVTYRHPLADTETKGASIGFRCIREE